MVIPPPAFFVTWRLTLTGLRKLLESRRFWVAVLGLVFALLSTFVPQFPPAVWQAILGLAGVLMALYTVDDTASAIKG